MRSPWLAAALLPWLCEVAGSSSVQVTWDDGRAALDNGRLRLEIEPDGVLRRLVDSSAGDLLENGGQGYWNAHCDNATGTRGFVRLGGPGRTVRATPDLVEVAYRHRPGGRWPREAFPFECELHYLLRADECGFHLFMTIEHGPGLMAARAAQYAYNLRLDPQTFDIIAVDDRRRHRSHTPQEERAAPSIMDATYRLADGRVVSKYDYCLDIAADEFHAYGWASSHRGVGVWLIQGSAEYYSCAPFRQFLSAHQTSTTPIIIWQPQCTHFGGVPIDVQEGERWRKLYGPLFFSVEHGKSANGLWSAAKRTAARQQASWPPSWMEHPWFPLERGGVSGRLSLPRGRPASGAWVVLAPATARWDQDFRGYHFWGRTDADGQFRITHIRPGAYRLSAIGCDQFDEFRSPAPIRVPAGAEVSLGELRWSPVEQDRTVWQIGRVDRSAAEFCDGGDSRHWGMWRRFARSFPDGVRFRVGAGDPARHWPYAHWNWYCGDDPRWRIEFECDNPPAAKQALLIFGIAASAGYDPRRKRMNPRVDAEVLVFVNDVSVGVIRAPYSGGAGHRGGCRTTRYSVFRFPFDVRLLHAGRNVVTLQHARSDRYTLGDPMGESGPGPGYLMYDAIRLSLTEPSAAGATAAASNARQTE